MEFLESVISLSKEIVNLRNDTKKLESKYEQSFKNINIRKGLRLSIEAVEKAIEYDLQENAEDEKILLKKLYELINPTKQTTYQYAVSKLTFKDKLFLVIEK